MEGLSCDRVAERPSLLVALRRVFTGGFQGSYHEKVTFYELETSQEEWNPFIFQSFQEM